MNLVNVFMVLQSRLNYNYKIEKKIKLKLNYSVFGDSLQMYNILNDLILSLFLSKIIGKKSFAVLQRPQLHEPCKHLYRFPKLIEIQ